MTVERSDRGVSRGQGAGAAPAAVDGAEGGQLLLVDDDRSFCRALAGALRRRGYNVLIAHDVDEAIAEARDWHPTHAVIDLRMPGRSGLDLLEELAQRGLDVTCVVLTGYGSIPTAVEAIKRGAVQYLTKPVSVDQIVSALAGQEPSGTVEPTVPSLDDVEWDHLQRVLGECGGNVSEAARRLGMHRRTLQRKLARRRGG